jgi:hypothetical protein
VVGLGAVGVWERRVGRGKGAVWCGSASGCGDGLASRRLVEGLWVGVPWVAVQGWEYEGQWLRVNGLGHALVWWGTGNHSVGIQRA